MNDESEKLTKYINKPTNHFFYTNTVEKEFSVTNITIPNTFKKINSDISQRKIEIVLDAIKKDVDLQESQIRKFKNDLTIILEAGYHCYDDGVTSPNDFTEPKLLTNNLKLYKKFINVKTNMEHLEKIINLNGLEHLIDVVRPNDVII